MNSKENKVEYSTLLKYFENKASEEEANMIVQWLKDPESSIKKEKYMHLLWSELAPETKKIEIDHEALLDKIHHRIHLRSIEQRKGSALSAGRKSAGSIIQIVRNLSRVAAIFLFAVLSYIGWKTYTQRLWVKNQAQATYNEIICPLGAQSQFVLPDGTKVYLNNGSKLIYPVKFTGNIRKVELYGEAYFDVFHNKQRPFIIHTVGLDMKVLGTRLNIYSYPDEKYQEITLASGSVELIQQLADQEVSITRMKPGQHVVYSFGADEADYQSKNTDKDLIILKSRDLLDDLSPRLKQGKKIMCRLQEGDLYLKNDEPDQYTGWIDGKLILRNDPMPVLLKRMERWYSVKFNIKDDRINDYTYWATFEEENLDQVLRLLSLTGPVKFNMLPREKTEDGTYKIQEVDVSIK